MATVIDSRGVIWFADQSAGYIGRFEPSQHAFQTFPLGTWKGAALGPQDLQFDASGLLWFTAEDVNAIGRLDPRTGPVHVSSLPDSASGLVVATHRIVCFDYLANCALC